MLATTQPLPTPSLSVLWPEGVPVPSDVPPKRPPADLGGIRPPLRRKQMRARSKNRSCLTGKSRHSRRLRCLDSEQEDDSKTESSPSGNLYPSYTRQHPELEPGLNQEEREESEEEVADESHNDVPLTWNRASGDQLRLHSQSRKIGGDILKRLVDVSASGEATCKWQSVLDLGLTPWHIPSPSTPCFTESSHPRSLKRNRKREPTVMTKAFSLPELSREDRPKFRHLDDIGGYIREYRKLHCVGGVGQAITPAHTAKLGVHVPDPYVARLKMLWPGMYESEEDNDADQDFLRTSRLTMECRENNGQWNQRYCSTEDLHRQRQAQSKPHRDQDQQREQPSAEQPCEERDTSLQKAKSILLREPQQPFTVQRLQHPPAPPEVKEERQQRPHAKVPPAAVREKTSGPTLHIATLVDPQSLSDSINQYLSLQQNRSYLPSLARANSRVRAASKSGLAIGPSAGTSDSRRPSDRLPDMTSSAVNDTSTSLPATSRAGSGTPLTSESRSGSAKSQSSLAFLSRRLKGAHLASLRHASSSPSSSSSSAKTVANNGRPRRKGRSKLDPTGRASAPESTGPVLPLVDTLPCLSTDGHRSSAASTNKTDDVPEVIGRELSRLKVTSERRSLADARNGGNERRPTIIDVSFTATSALDLGDAQPRVDRGRGGKVKGSGLRF